MLTNASTFHQDTTIQNDVFDFLDRFEEQTSYLLTSIHLSLLE